MGIGDLLVSNNGLLVILDFVDNYIGELRFVKSKKSLKNKKTLCVTHKFPSFFWRNGSFSFIHGTMYPLIFPPSKFCWQP